jgi:tetratricopeptide (TPR) repeat protein
MKKKFIKLTLIFFASGLLHAAGNDSTLPPWFIPLRDAVYEQELKADEIAPLYRDALVKAGLASSESEKLVLFSRCEYMMGRAYQYEERKEEASLCYERGMKYAEDSIKLDGGAWACQMFAENISQACAVRGTSYAVSNGLKVEEYAKKALKLDADNVASLLMVASRWIYAPWPFHNHSKGIKLLNEIISKYDKDDMMQRDDHFNVYIALGFVYNEQKKKADARRWLEKALSVYPTNKYADKLLILNN